MKIELKRVFGRTTLTLSAEAPGSVHAEETMTRMLAIANAAEAGSVPKIEVKKNNLRYSDDELAAIAAAAEAWLKTTYSEEKGA